VVETFPAPPATLSAHQSEVAWRLARILLHRAEPDFARSDALLDRVVTSLDTTDAEAAPSATEASSLLASARQLRIISLAAQARLADARALLDEVPVDKPEQLLAVLNDLTRVAEDLGIEHQSGLGRMQLDLARQIAARQSELSESDQRLLENATAQAHAALGQWKEAAEIYEAILWKQPADAAVRGELARLYEACGTPGCYREALKQWQALERLQRKGSVEWLETRYHLAWVHLRTGDDATARKLIEVTRLLYPQLGTPSLKAQYQALAAEMGQK
jgi:tetratricopeptide (TPR) repeat protein